MPAADGAGDAESTTSAGGASSSAQTESVQGQTKTSKRGKHDQQEAPPGYIQSLVNKIISNVKVVCNNLILKYVEDDIVLSLNTRCLSLSSANEIWEEAFVDGLSQATGFIQRKLLQVWSPTQLYSVGFLQSTTGVYKCGFLVKVTHGQGLCQLFLMVS